MVKITRRDFIRAGSLAAALSALNWSALVKAAGEAVRSGAETSSGLRHRTVQVIPRRLYKPQTPRYLTCF